MKESFLISGVLKYHPVISKEGPKILKYLDQSFLERYPAMRRFLASHGMASPGYTTKEILKDSSASAATDPDYILKMYTEAHQEAIRKVKNDQERTEVNMAFQQIKRELLYLAGMTQRQREAEFALYRMMEVPQGQTRQDAYQALRTQGGVGVVGSPLDTFQTQYPDGAVIKGELFTFANLRPGEYAGLGSPTEFQVNYIYDDANKSLTTNIKDIGKIPEWAVKSFSQEFSGLCVVCYGEGASIELNFFNEKHYESRQKGPGAAGIVRLEKEHDIYVNFIHNMAVALYQKGLKLNKKQFDALTPEMQELLRKIEAERNFQIAQGRQFAQQTRAAGNQPLNVMQPLIPPAPPAPAPAVAAAPPPAPGPAVAAPSPPGGGGLPPVNVSSGIFPPGAPPPGSVVLPPPPPPVGGPPPASIPGAGAPRPIVTLTAAQLLPSQQPLQYNPDALRPNYLYFSNPTSPAVNPQPQGNDNFNNTFESNTSSQSLDPINNGESIEEQEDLWETFNDTQEQLEKPLPNEDEDEYIKERKALDDEEPKRIPTNAQQSSSSSSTKAQTSTFESVLDSYNKQQQQQDDSSAPKMSKRGGLGSQ